MHGDKSQRQREAALARFERGEVMTLVATDVAARGIDVPDVVRVINYDAPEDRAAYVHRIGRTGRAGRTGTGISFVLADEVKEMRQIARQLGIEFGDGHTEGGAAQPKPSGEGQRPQGEKRRGGSGKPGQGGDKRSHGGSSQGGKRSQGGSNRSAQGAGDKRQSDDGPRSKRRRRRRKPASATTAS
jgi:superfamily II DNA/RNA helicase